MYEVGQASRLYCPGLEHLQMYITVNNTNTHTCSSVNWHTVFQCIWYVMALRIVHPLMTNYIVVIWFALASWYVATMIFAYTLCIYAMVLFIVWHEMPREMRMSWAQCVDVSIQVGRSLINTIICTCLWSEIVFGTICLAYRLPTCKREKKSVYIPCINVYWSVITSEKVSNNS